MDNFLSPEDIVNHGLIDLGAAPITSLADGSRNALLAAQVYDRLRLRELRRNVWTFAARKTRIWPISTTTLLLTFPAYSAATTYAVADIVVGTDGTVWVSRQPANVGNTPSFDASGPLWWDVFFGPQVAQYWNLPVIPGTTNSTPTSYDPGEIVYMITGASTANVYQSLTSTNTKTPNLVDAWSSSVMYNSGQVVSSGGTNYQSLGNFNFNNQPPNGTWWTTVITSPTVSNSWRQITSATLAPLIVNWPLNTQPLENTASPNAYLVPYGFQRIAPQRPGAGRISTYLGFPRNEVARDWELDGDYIVSSNTLPMEFRFVADIVDVSSMDPMFCSGLGHTIGAHLARALSYENAVVKEQNDKADKMMEDARQQNAIEQGDILPPLDDFIACRL